MTYLMFSERLPSFVRFLTEFTDKRWQTDMSGFNVLLDILKRVRGLITEVAHP